MCVTVGELKSKLALYRDDIDVCLVSDCIFGAEIQQDFAIQTNDGDENSPLFIEFGLSEMVTPIAKFVD